MFKKTFYRRIDFGETSQPQPQPSWTLVKPFVTGAEGQVGFFNLPSLHIEQ